MDGQARRAWLNRIDEKVGNALRSALGPQGSQALNNVLTVAEAVNPAVDVRDAYTASGDLWEGGDLWDQLGDGAALGGAMAMMFAPGSMGSMRQGFDDLSSEMARAYDPTRVNALVYRRGGHVGEHSAPVRDAGNASLDDLTKVYPEDVYSSRGPSYYGTGDDADAMAFRIARSVRGDPDAEIPVWRAVPKGVTQDIFADDWVSITRPYAEQHGEYFDEGADILQEFVRAGDLFTDGNSIHEWGWSPKVPQDATAIDGIPRLTHKRGEF